MKKMKTVKKYMALYGGLALLMAGVAGCGTAKTVQESVQETGGQTGNSEETGGQQKEESQTDARIICGQDGIHISGSGVTEEDGIITITKAGTYRFTGTLKDGRIVVDADKESVVTLQLAGFEVTSSDLSAVYGKKSKEIVMLLEEGTANIITDSAEYVLEEGEDEPDAAVFTKGDLTIDGSGSLEVIGSYNDGIRSKDNLRIVSGEVKVTAVEDGIKGKDSLVIDGGTITVSVGDDAVKSKGPVTVNGGTVTVTESYEGIEAQTIDINGGTIDIKSSDDGLNAVDDTAGDDEGTNRRNGSFEVSENAYIRISGGTVTIDADADGVDSNGHFYMDGGTLLISGPVSGGDGALDYNGNGVITGGVVIAAGSSGMAQNFSGATDQAAILVYFEETKQAGTEISITDGSGKVIASYAPVKEYSSAVISAPEIVLDGVYQITSGEEVLEVTADSAVMTAGTRPAGGMGGMGRGGGRPGGERPEGMKLPDGELPEGMELPDGEPPQGMEKADGMEPPDGEVPSGTGHPDGERPSGGMRGGSPQDGNAEGGAGKEKQEGGKTRDAETESGASGETRQSQETN